MKPNKFLMQGFIPPVLDDSQSNLNVQTFSQRRKTDNNRKYVRAYKDAAVIHNYRTEMSQYMKKGKAGIVTDSDKNKNSQHALKRRRVASSRTNGKVDIMRSKPSRTSQITSSRVTKSPAKLPSGITRHQFSEPSSRHRP